MSARKPKLPANVVSLAEYRGQPEPPPVRDAMSRARLVAEIATSLGVDLRLAIAIQRGEITPIA